MKRIPCRLREIHAAFCGRQVIEGLQVAERIIHGRSEDVDLFRRGIYADELVAEAVTGVKIAILARSNGAGEGGAVLKNPTVE